MKTTNNKISLFDSILFALMVVFLVIGIHQCYIIGKVEGWKMGFVKSYSFFMLVIVLMVVRQVRKNREEKSESQSENSRITTDSKPKGKQKKK
jgi:Ca2+/Na+ antiporter